MATLFYEAVWPDLVTFFVGYGVVLNLLISYLFLVVSFRSDTFSLVSASPYTSSAVRLEEIHKGGILKTFKDV